MLRTDVDLFTLVEYFCALFAILFDSNSTAVVMLLLIFVL